jgi:cold shock CspA family protein
LALSQRMGFIKCWFGGEGGYGFIQPDDGDEVVFVHHTGIAANTKARSLTEGTGVRYEVAHRGMGGMLAKNVCKAGSS